MRLVGGSKDTKLAWRPLSPATCGMIERVLVLRDRIDAMSDRFLTRQLAQLGLVANALRPLPGAPVSVPAFFSGWLTSELSPHLMGVSALDTATHLARHGVSTRGDALGAAVA